MKLKVRVEFDIEGDQVLDEDELKEMIYTYLAEAIESGELEYDVEVSDEDELN
jgi:uncharacterized protein YpmS